MSFFIFDLQFDLKFCFNPCRREMIDFSTVREFFQSVLQQANSLVSPANDHLLTPIQEHYGLGVITKKQGVSGQSMDPAKSVQLQKVEKDIR